jgi:FdhD protein
MKSAGPAASAAVRMVDLQRFSAQSGPPRHERVGVVEETFLSVWIEEVGRYILVCTPCDLEALAVGFALSEGLISGMDEVLGLGRRADDPDAISLSIRDPSREAPGRNLLMTSSCGVCGARNLETFLVGDVSVPRTLEMPAALLPAIAREMRSRQDLFARTGGTHAAAVFQGDGRIAAFAEDIGRHSALDKAVGKCLMAGISPRGCGALLSGRASFEIVAKAARAGIELLAAVSAPSALAVDVAEACGITLCAFVREDRVSAYTHPERIRPGAEQE